MQSDMQIHDLHDRAGINQLGLWLFFLSETMIFVILLTARFSLTGAGRPAGLNQALGFILTLVLLASSISAYRAETAIRFGDRRLFLQSLLLTIGMGLLFLAGVVGLEWREAGHMGIVPQSGYGIAFFSMTGMHALHVLSGITLLIVIYFNGRRGAYSPQSHWGVEASVKYWHFVDLVWVFFYPALYLLG
jgi:cytochrome c oxidase subunit III